MQTNIAGASGKVNYFEADLILTNHRFLGSLSAMPVYQDLSDWLVARS